MTAWTLPSVERGAGLLSLEITEIKGRPFPASAPRHMWEHVPPALAFSVTVLAVLVCDMGETSIPAARSLGSTLTLQVVSETSPWRSEIAHSVAAWSRPPAARRGPTMARGVPGAGAEWRAVPPQDRPDPAGVFQNPLVGTEEEDWFIGDEAQSRREKLHMQCPISRATVTSWDNMEKVAAAPVGEGPARGAPRCLAPGKGSPVPRPLGVSRPCRHCSTYPPWTSGSETRGRIVSTAYYLCHVRPRGPPDAHAPLRGSWPADCTHRGPGAGAKPGPAVELPPPGRALR